MKHLPLSLILIFCFVFGGIIFKITSPTTCNKILQNDNIFVLTGDHRRIPFAVQKVQQLKEANLYIIGAGVTNIPNVQHVKIETSSKSTYQNALAIKNIVQTKHITSLVLITTIDHMNRSLYLLRSEMPNTNIIACSVPLYGMPTSTRLKRWTIEYIKYLATILGVKES